MRLPELVAELLDLANDGPPDAHTLEVALAPRATRITRGDDRPPWADEIWMTGDAFLYWTGDVQGIALWDDSRGWGAYAELAVTRGTLADLEAVVGELDRIPRRSDGGGPSWGAHVGRGGKRLRVMIEIDGAAPANVTRIRIHFQN